MKLSKEQFMGIIRHTLTFVGGTLITMGIIDDLQFAELSGSILTFIGTIWSIVVKNSAEKLPDQN